MKHAQPVLSVFFVTALLLSASGCVPLILGGAAGALGACAISKDTIQGDMDKDYGRLWNSTVMVARSRGAIKEEDNIRGYLQFQDGVSLVTVKLTRLTRSAVRIKVTARKHHLPDINLAQEVFVKITEGAQ